LGWDVAFYTGIGVKLVKSIFRSERFVNKWNTALTTEGQPRFNSEKNCPKNRKKCVPPAKKIGKKCAYAEYLARLSFGKTLWV
jgi:hypothetical protein